MNLEIETQGNVKIVRVKEDRLVYSVLSSFYSAVTEIVDSGHKQLVIDLSQVHYLDSASIGCLMDIYRSANDASGDVKLVGLQERVETMVSMTGLHNFIEIFPDDASALKSF